MTKLLNHQLFSFSWRQQTSSKVITCYDTYNSFGSYKLWSERHLSPLQHQHMTTFSKVTSLSHAKPDNVFHPLEWDICSESQQIHFVMVFTMFYFNKSTKVTVLFYSVPHLWMMLYFFKMLSNLSDQVKSPVTEKREKSHPFLKRVKIRTLGITYHSASVTVSWWKRSPWKVCQGMWMTRKWLEISAWLHETKILPG